MSTSLDPYPPAVPPGEDELPSSDGMPMETERHRDQMILLIESLKLAWADRDDFCVSGNMFMYFSIEQAKHNDFVGPDVFVVLDTVRRERKSWVVWQEGGRTPNVVIELLSESTEEDDRGKKMTIYAKQLHVAEYYLFDPWTGVLEGYDLRTSPPHRMPTDEHGDLESRELGLRLGVREGMYNDVKTRWLRWLDGEGHVLATNQERLAAIVAQDEEIAALRKRLDALEKKA